MSNEKKNDIEDIFSKDMEEEITKELKVKRKKYNAKLIAKTISLTLVILLVVSSILNVASEKVLSSSYIEAGAMLNKEYTVMHPTEYIGKSEYVKTGLFKSLILYDIGKLIEGKVVNAGTKASVGGLQYGIVGEGNAAFKEGNITEDLNQREYASNGLRRLVFMLPYVDYDTKINDFKYLDEIDNNKYVEMVISFDKEYSYEEVNKSFGSDRISFYWIDRLDNEKRELYKSKKLYVKEFAVVGIKSNTADGKWITDESDRLKEYKEAVKYLKNETYMAYSDIDENNTNVSGIVVQGTPKELKELQNNPMIKHAVLGNVVDKY